MLAQIHFEEEAYPLKLRKLSSALIVTCSCFVSAVALPGCDNKEKVLDIETPAGEIEVERDKDTGAIDVEIEENN